MDKGEKVISFHITESEKRRFESINQSLKDVKMDVVDTQALLQRQQELDQQEVHRLEGMFLDFAGKR